MKTVHKHITARSVSQITPNLIQRYVLSVCENNWVGVPLFHLKLEIEHLVLKGVVHPLRLKIKQGS